LTKSGKNIWKRIIALDFGLIFVLIVVAGINATIKDVPLAEDTQQAAQQTGETDLIEAQIRAEGTASGQDSGFAESNY